jgi:hypothetical protein
MMWQISSFSWTEEVAGPILINKLENGCGFLLLLFLFL